MNERRNDPPALALLEAAGRAEQLAADIYGAAAHAGDDAGVFEVEAAEPAQDHIAAGARVPHDAKHLGVERLDLGPLDDGAPLPPHAGADVVDLPVRFRLGKKALGPAQSRSQQ